MVRDRTRTDENLKYNSHEIPKSLLTQLLFYYPASKRRKSTTKKTPWYFHNNCCKHLYNPEHSLWGGCQWTKLWAIGQTARKGRLWVLPLPSAWDLTPTKQMPFPPFTYLLHYILLILERVQMAEPWHSVEKPVNLLSPVTPLYDEVLIFLGQLQLEPQPFFVPGKTENTA